MDRAQLPFGTDLRDGAYHPADEVDLVNRLVDQRTAPFALPGTFSRPRIVLLGSMSLDVAIALEDTSQAPVSNRLGNEHARIVEPSLANYIEQHSPLLRDANHLTGSFHGSSNGLLHLNVLARLRAETDRLLPKVGISADVHDIDVRQPAEFRIRRYKFRSVLGCEPAAGFFRPIAADDVETKILTSLRVQVRNGARSNDSDSHGTLRWQWILRLLRCYGLLRNKEDFEDVHLTTLLDGKKLSPNAVNSRRSGCG